MKIKTAIASLIVLGACSARADIVYMDDGTHVEGKISKNDSGALVVTTSKGIEITVQSAKIVKIVSAPSDAPDPAAGDRDKLASLRRVAENIPDIHQVIDRYEKFIAQNPTSAVIDDAKGDLLLWHDRLDKGLVKVGGNWVTADQRDQIQAGAQVEALAARDLMKQDRMKDAEPILLKAIVDDPQNATALYLQGILLYKQDQIEKARKSFEAVNEVIPGYAPVLNNLAVAAWRQKSFVAAMNFYDHAMLASPLARQVLDNVAEALHALPDENKEAPVVKKCAQHFQEQDAQLQKLAADQGWFRWGSTWVTAKQLDELKAAEAKIKEQLDALNKEGDDVRSKIGSIDAEVDTNQRQMDRLQAASIMYDQNGNQIQLPLPPAYYNLQRDNAKLAQDKKNLQDHFEDLKVKYKQIEASAPVPQFSGNQQLVGIEAAPVKGTPPDANPTTMPSAFGPATQP